MPPITREWPIDGVEDKLLVWSIVALVFVALLAVVVYIIALICIVLRRDPNSECVYVHGIPLLSVGWWGGGIFFRL
jgi:heme/copper-type cytochrome/quinol oxidase subunit 2